MNKILYQVVKRKLKIADEETIKKVVQELENTFGINENSNVFDIEKQINDKDFNKLINQYSAQK